MLSENCSMACWFEAVVIGMLFGSAMTVFVMLVLRWKKKRDTGF